MNMGATTHAPPVAIPAKTRAAYSIETLDAVTVSIHVMRKGRLSNMLVYFRPSLSARIPAGIAPTNAPMASRDPTQDSKESERRRFEFDWNCAVRYIYTRSVGLKVMNS